MPVVGHYHFWILEKRPDGRLAYVKNDAVYRERTNCHRAAERECDYPVHPDQFMVRLCRMSHKEG